MVVDTLRADRLGEYGHARDTSGAMGRFFARATRFDAAYAPSSWTRPSVASLFSGLLPARHRAQIGGTNRLNRRIATLAEVLHQRGYATWGASHNVVVSEETGFAQGFDHFLGVEGEVLDYPDLSRMTEGARAWAGGAPEPFLLYLQPMNVHGPYKAPEEVRERFLGRPPSFEFNYYDPLMSAISQGRLEARRGVGGSYLESLRDQYDSAVRYSMDQLATVLEALEARGVADRTLVVVTSDHGEELFDHGGFAHGYSLFEEVVRVPLFVRRPGQQQASVIADPVTLADLYPSILELAGFPPRHAVDGRSFLPLLEGSPEVEERSLVFDIRHPERCSARAIRRGRYKMILVESNYEGLENRAALFDLEADPQERRNLVAERPELARELAEELNARLAELEAGALPLPEEGDAVEDQERLKALGYL